MRVEFECIICGEIASATVAADNAPSDAEPMKTLRDCPNCQIETVWLEL